MSDTGFWLMTLLFHGRDIIWPPIETLKAAGLIHEGARVLDFGCGPGSYTVAAAKLVGAAGRVYALDIHPRALASARRRATAEGVSDIITTLDGRADTVADACLDAVILFDVFHLLDDQPGALREINRMLKPEGRLLFSDHHMKREAIIAGVTAGGLFAPERDHDGVYIFSKAALR
ncbi:MAG: class I SAM-dependent methyltransferase [Nitrospinae bacterium]|nr:class I SAM-dependent methyltransferase [Nitrospinota bacterium]